MTLALVGLLSTTRSADAQSTYKWTDKDGKVHFSNVAPAGQQGDQPSGVTGIEASGGSGEAPEAANEQPGMPPPLPPGVVLPGGSAPSAPSAPSTQSASAAVSDETFSSQATATRLRLKREIAQAKEEVKAVGDEIAAAKKDRDLAQKPGLEMLQNAFDPNHQHSSKDMDDLEKKKEKAEAKVEDIRKQYSTMRDEAARRNGGQTPSWWLPIE